VKVAIDADRCGGHGVCSALCPTVFALNDDGYSEVLLPDVPADLEEAVQNAVRQCPEKAISTS
jgi:ferredoxin